MKTTDQLYDEYIDSGAYKHESFDEFIDNYVSYMEDK